MFTLKKCIDVYVQYKHVIQVVLNITVTCPVVLGFQLQPSLQRDSCQDLCRPSPRTVQAAVCRSGPDVSFLGFHQEAASSKQLVNAVCHLCSALPAIHHPLFLPLLRLNVQRCLNKVSACPDIPAVSSTRAQAATDFWWKGWTIIPGCLWGVKIDTAYHSACSPSAQTSTALDLSFDFRPVQ